MGLEYDITDFLLTHPASLLLYGNSFSSISIGHSVQTKEIYNNTDPRRSLESWTGPRAPRWVHNISLISVSLRQSDWRPTFCQTKVAVKRRLKIWLVWRSVSLSRWTEQNPASTLTYQVGTNKELFEGNGQGEKLNAGILEGLQIWEIMQAPKFDKTLSQAELSTWQSLKTVVANFLGNHRSAEYKKGIEDLQKVFRLLGTRMTVKLHFLRLPLDNFQTSGKLSQEQGKWFQQDIWIMEEHYQGRWNVNFLTDYCWCLTWDAVAAEHSR